MSPRRVLAIGLDGYSVSLADRLMAEGALPALAALRAGSAAFLLDHGPAQRSGLAYEHISTGLSPADSGRQSAVHFDPHSYQVWQQGTTRAPFAAALTARTVVFDVPYFWLERAPAVQGLVGWGAHDPGVAPHSRPDSLSAEIDARFGPYPAREYLYATPWMSAPQCARMGAALQAATEQRSEIASWLLGERLTDWQLGLVVVSELHSAHEGLWHGVDAGHPAHSLPSAAPAARGLRAVYGAVDRLVGTLAERFPDADLLVFATGGMGPNHSDLASMALLPELLHREAFGSPRLKPRREWLASVGGTAALGETETCWSSAVTPRIDPAPRRWSKWWHRVSGSRWPHPAPPAGARPLPLDWMPATRYRAHWRRMRAFALPSFYDGRIRLNLIGREARGRVPRSEYSAALRALEQLLLECRDPATGRPVVGSFEHQAGADPGAAGPSLADLVVIWSHGFNALEHPRYGLIGPLPWRRTGGHTGAYGMAWLRSPRLPAGEQGVRSTFDVVPTLIDLLQEPEPPAVSGVSLLVEAPAGSERCAGIAAADGTPSNQQPSKPIIRLKNLLYLTEL